MDASKVPGILELLQRVWMSLGLFTLLVFSFRMTFLTASAYGALPAAIIFLVLGLIIVFTVIFGTSQRTGGLLRY